MNKVYPQYSLLLVVIMLSQKSELNTIEHILFRVSRKVNKSY